MADQRLVVVVPSRGRPERCAEALTAAKVLATGHTQLYAAVDTDDPALPDYYRVLRGTATVHIVPGSGAAGMVAALNHAATTLVAQAGVGGVMFMGDDHMCRTQGWDEALTAALGGRPGVAYGNDLLQRENLATAAVVDARIIRALGYMVPPVLAHLYADDFWMLLGRDLNNLAYLPDVIIEHMHPAAGKAERDAGYDRVNAPGVWERDRAAWDNFAYATWPHHFQDLTARLRC